MTEITYLRWPNDQPQPKPNRMVPDGYHDHPNGGGIVADEVEIGNHIFVGIRALICGGVFRGGEFRGGEFRGGYFRGGYFHGGEFRGGYFHGGYFHGGLFHGGVFRGGEFRSGEFHCGEFRGGVFRSGEFHGGEFHDGEWAQTPLFLDGVCCWGVGECGHPAAPSAYVGCHVGAPAELIEQYESGKIGASIRATEGEFEKIKRALAYLESEWAARGVNCEASNDEQ